MIVVFLHSYKSRPKTTNKNKNPITTTLLKVWRAPLAPANDQSGQNLPDARTNVCSSTDARSVSNYFQLLGRTGSSLALTLAAASHLLPILSSDSVPGLGSIQTRFSSSRQPAAAGRHYRRHCDYSGAGMLLLRH